MHVEPSFSEEHKSEDAIPEDQIQQVLEYELTSPLCLFSHPFRPATLTKLRRK
jgi:hypothetical protein